MKQGGIARKNISEREIKILLEQEKLKEILQGKSKK